MNEMYITWSDFISIWNLSFRIVLIQLVAFEPWKVIGLDKPQMFVIFHFAN